MAEGSILSRESEKSLDSTDTPMQRRRTTMMRMTLIWMTPRAMSCPMVKHQRRRTRKRRRRQRSLSSHLQHLCHNLLQGSHHGSLCHHILLSTHKWPYMVSILPLLWPVCRQIHLLAHVPPASSP